VEQDLQGMVIQETVAGKVLWENNYWKIVICCLQFSVQVQRHTNFWNGKNN
jgi:hypothetical protein